ncbi:MAG: hypothetical protein EPO51_11030 [Phenylobacterium sp.]|uniref:hypothetical protein n=1 Tax=Phenylobacterium sp. TaxID=1871053 RepID=UPI00120355DC|nr:hypothetical protein [Phenylobacterium sp.]TAJ71661.1 MAG: hypothetical protein EPO51_11030 [Phenylobacterium sp.]
MILLAFLFAAATADLDPLSPAEGGKLQCHAPDVARKTCASIAAYARDPDGTLQNTAAILLRAEPLIVARSKAPVVIKGGAVCGRITEGDFAAMLFTIDGQPADAPNAEAIRNAMRPGFNAILNREICTRYVPTGDQLNGEVSVDGKRRPQLDQPVRWVSPSEGFSVAP